MHTKSRLNASIRDKAQGAARLKAFPYCGSSVIKTAVVTTGSMGKG